MSQLAVGTLFILGGILGGVCGAALTYWGLERLLVTLSYRLADLEDRLIREVKARAGQISQDKKKGEDKIVQWAENEMNVSKAAAPSLPAWQRKFMSK